MSAAWPNIPYEPWRETCSALHLYTQIVGKYRLARTPWINHSWQATFYINARGFTSSLVPDGPGGVEIGFDLLNHAVTGSATDGRSAQFSLAPMSVAEFHRRFLDMIRSLGGTPEFHGCPTKCATRSRLRRIEPSAPTPPMRKALVAVDQVLKRFRTAFLGKVSPVHLFWGSFDLAVTRFSGRSAPLHPGGVPGLPDEVTREAYSHEVSSAGFWAWRWRRRFPGVLFLLLSDARRLRQCARGSGCGIFRQALGRVYPAL